MLVRMATAFEVLADPRRRQLLDLLRAGERPVGELVDRLGLSQPGALSRLLVRPPRRPCPPPGGESGMTADLQTIDGRPALRFERYLDHPVERVWRAVSEPAEVRRWMPAAADCTLTLGYIFELGGQQ